MDKNVVLTTLEMAGEGRSPGGARRLPEEKAADPVWTCPGARRVRPRSPTADVAATGPPRRARSRAGVNQLQPSGFW